MGCFLSGFLKLPDIIIFYICFDNAWIPMGVGIIKHITIQILQFLYLYCDITCKYVNSKASIVISKPILSLKNENTWYIELIFYTVELPNMLHILIIQNNTMFNSSFKLINICPNHILNALERIYQLLLPCSCLIKLYQTVGKSLTKKDFLYFNHPLL